MEFYLRMKLLIELFKEILIRKELKLDGYLDEWKEWDWTQ